MPVAYEVPRIDVLSGAPSSIQADLLVVPLAEDHCAGTVAEFDAAVGGALGAALARGEFTPKALETFCAPILATGWASSRMLFVSGGHREDMGPERFRRMAASAVALARHQRLPRVAWLDVEPGRMAAGERIDILGEAVTVANFDGGIHKSRPDPRFFLTDVSIVTAASGALDRAGAGRIVGDAVNSARVLINEPGNFLAPATFVDKAASLASVDGVGVEVFDERRLEALGTGLLLGVGRGSAEPPRMLIARYEPAGAAADVTLGLVGKGITFDTGGISIKPADGMERMKDDMAGAASVVAALRAIALLRLPIRAVAVVASAENMPGGRALKPGDILRGASGLTVEVNNTDAEGRLILGDALWYARTIGATHLVDVATLTGACIVALGKITTGLFGTPQIWVDTIRAAADRGGEKVWQMPLFEEYKDTLKSDMADLINSPGRTAGAITAAMFLQEFAGTGPWAHLDIAGTAWADETKAWMPRGATGAIIRTLVELGRGPFPR
ncbi:MAG: leucyl aminopeptidase [Acidobacteria bacterium]|nr:leucyl aminopeptidase [Acidobacteriota bacterium]